MSNTQAITTTAQVRELKEAGQDFEWYPTTNAMIHAVFSHCHLEYSSSVLDIGAGDGRVLEYLDRLTFESRKKDPDNQDSKQFHSCIDKYAIEKSTVHLDNLPPDIAVIGTDFKLQTLIDKKVDFIFCNPPYSEYKDWAVKVIKEANCKKVFLILPKRWAESEDIQHAIKQRKAVKRVIWSGDFNDAERAARAEVDIVEVFIDAPEDSERWSEKDKSNPFDVWFEEYFSGFAEKVVDDFDEEEDEDEQEPINEITEGQNLIERLAELYMRDMQHLLANYKSLSELDASLLKELDVDVSSIRKALKMKISGLKTHYWKELFDNLDKVNEKLTSGSRASILKKLEESCNIDFSCENAYALVLWVIKNANKYIDTQLVDMFKDLTQEKHIKNYKSNQKTWERGEWRYGKHRVKHTHYTLDYRIVTERRTAIKPNDSYWSSHFEKNLEVDCHAFINDMFTIANNLDFSIPSYHGSLSREWESNKQQDFYCIENGKDRTLLASIRAFKNGNVHFKFNQKFIKTLNVEASRLLKWCRTPEQAAEETGYSIDFVKSCFRSNLLLGTADGQKLLMG